MRERLWKGVAEARTKDANELRVASVSGATVRGLHAQYKAAKTVKVLLLTGIFSLSARTYS